MKKLIFLFLFKAISCHSFEIEDSTLFKSQASIGFNLVSFSRKIIKENSDFGNLNFVNIGLKNKINNTWFLKQGINFTPRNNWSKLYGGVISSGVEKKIISKGKNHIFIGGDIIYRFIRNNQIPSGMQINTYSINLSCNYSYLFSRHLGFALDISPSIFNVTYQKIGHELIRKNYYEYFSYKYFSIHILYSLF